MEQLYLSTMHQDQRLIKILYAVLLVLIVILVSKRVVKVSKRIIERIAKNEGGYVNDPDDSGGETKYGISKRAYPNLDIKNLTIEQAHAIYEKDYFSKLPKVEDEEFQYHLYDHGINAGVSQALKIYKDSLNSSNPAQKAKELRQEFYRKIAVGKNAKFLKGWLNRTNF